jgi:hypothetical protein
LQVFSRGQDEERTGLTPPSPVHNNNWCTLILIKVPHHQQLVPHNNNNNNKSALLLHVFSRGQNEEHNGLTPSGPAPDPPLIPGTGEKEYRPRMFPRAVQIG